MMKGRNKIKAVFYCCLLFTVYCSLFTVFSFAEDTIRVLIYNSTIDVRKDNNGLYSISEVPFEKYVEGVVASEIGKGWDIEAVKVQAVIARTYAAYYKAVNAGKDYHLTSSVLSQVYKGENTDPWVAVAVKETEGEILTYDGKPIEAFYHSTAGGRTELPEEVWGKKKNYSYLKSVVCEDETSPYFNWKRKFSFKEIEKALGIKEIKEVSIAAFSVTGRVKTLKITAENSVKEINAGDLRRLLGYKELPSTFFTVKLSGSEVVFEGKGYGHGVGLSQWCAHEMAKQGKTYKEILAYFYPGAVLQRQGSRGQGVEESSENLKK
ncbi:MAG: SpoIID/LytB domain-containing protein [Nitrospirae bacterium]|nr:SpoIID/LytB domain-containing protein [Nitrospirota bacterium]